MQQITIQALDKIPMIVPGDDLAMVISQGLIETGLSLREGDVLVLAQKIVSKAEGRIVDLCSVTPGSKALELAKACDKDPRYIEMILSESATILRQVSGVLITQHKRGWVMANAGIDASNVSSKNGEENILLLPVNPDQTCAQLRKTLIAKHKVNIGVIISDSFGRPWRLGTTGVAIGAAGVPSLWDRRGDLDLYGRELKVSQQAVGDELATAASILQGQANEAQPIVLIRGLDFGARSSAINRPASDLIRDISEDLFR